MKFARSIHPGMLSAGIENGVIDLDLQGNFGHFDSEFKEIWLVCVITCYRFELESPN